MTVCDRKIATGRLTQGQLNTYQPLIWTELDKELALQDDDNTLRATREYGYSYFRMEQGDFSYTEAPAFLHDLGKLTCQVLGHAPRDFDNFIISLYNEGFWLEPHVDVGEEDAGQFGFSFDENVYGVVLEADSDGHLYITRKQEDGGFRPAMGLEESSGTVFCLNGEYRHAPFYHGVSKVSKRRVSVTFRQVQRRASLHALWPINLSSLHLYKMVFVEMQAVNTDFD